MLRRAHLTWWIWTKPRLTSQDAGSMRRRTRAAEPPDDFRRAFRQERPEERRERRRRQGEDEEVKQAISLAPNVPRQQPWDV